MDTALRALLTEFVDGCVHGQGAGPAVTDGALVAGIVGAMAGLAAVIALVMTLDSLRLLLFGRRAPGVIVEAEYVEGTDKDYWLPVIELHAGDGRAVRVRGRIPKKQESEIARGARLEMVHPHGRPDLAIERSFNGLLLLPLAFFAVAAVLAVIAWLKTGSPR